MAYTLYESPRSISCECWATIQNVSDFDGIAPLIETDSCNACHEELCEYCESFSCDDCKKLFCQTHECRVDDDLSLCPDCFAVWAADQETWDAA